MANQTPEPNTKPQKHPGGRPTKYKPEYCQQLIQCFKEGYGICTFADEIGINEDTFRQWQKDFPEFSAAFQKAKAAKGRWFEGIAQNHTVGTKDGPRVNTGLFTFMARVQLGWGEQNKQPIEVVFPQWVAPSIERNEQPRLIDDPIGP